MYLRLITILYLSSFSLFAQSDLPTDFLSKEFHKERRQKLREKLPPNSVAVFFANPVRNRANDVDFIYHQDPNFLYLTGYKEPHAVLLIFKDNQTSANGKSYDEIIFVQPRNAMREMWTGRRLGDEGTRNLLGLEQSFDNTEFKKYNVDFSKFDQVLFYDFFNDVRDDPSDPSDLYSLIEDFKVKVNYESKNNINVSLEQRKNNLNLTVLDGYMKALRGIKTEEELALIRKAVQISCQGQIEVMKALKPGMSEREIQGVHEFVFKKYQAEDVGYPSIVGAGHNGCILHYIENYQPEVSSKELILMDLGAEYRGYTADVTRTIPISGKFTPDQKAIYDIVLKAQEAAMKKVKPGVSFAELNQVTKDVVNKGLKDLGIIKSVDEDHLYYPHGCCHHIGLDVHDKGFRDAIQENMTFTIEPGIYIPENSNCDPRWWGIAVRIEDDFRSTKNGYEHLSDLAPRTTEDIEATMKLPSPLDNFILPDLKNKK
ncbi:MAG TPA: aminopeptidase P family protein [Cyclobacteriaceae bacterium]|nr:aminopeptidase P family protein [Cyclobacteriaceae bacterium]HRK54548.1 aminopeptidase P family protein [Cyclobacteriaceae bacterium]